MRHLLKTENLKPETLPSPGSTSLFQLPLPPTPKVWHKNGLWCLGQNQPKSTPSVQKQTKNRPEQAKKLGTGGQNQLQGEPL